MLTPVKGIKGMSETLKIRQGFERPVFQGCVQNKTTYRSIVQLADRKGGHSKSKQGPVDQRSNATRVRKAGRCFYNTNFQHLIRIHTQRKIYSFSYFQLTNTTFLNKVVFVN